MFHDIGRTLMILGAALLFLGALVHFGGRFLPLGSLPGDFNWENGRTSFFFPLGTSLFISLLLTILANLFLR